MRGAKEAYRRVGSPAEEDWVLVNTIGRYLLGILESRELALVRHTCW